jgi:hypothetical protein
MPTVLSSWCAKINDERNEEDLIAAWLVGNGVLLLIAPQRRALLWLFERPEGVRKLHPLVRRSPCAYAPTRYSGSGNRHVTCSEAVPGEFSPQVPALALSIVYGEREQPPL